MRNLIITFAGLLFFILNACNSPIENSEESHRIPSIFPDYTGILLPPNIAPLNFKINEPGDEFEARLSVPGADQIVVRSNNPTIQINVGKWHKLLEKGKGEKLTIEVFVKSEEGNWKKFQPIENEISSESIDNHLAYRLISTAYVVWNNMGIYQRNLENFDEKPIIENKAIDHGCVNCHTFANNDPNNMMFHIRAIHGGTLINHKGKLSKINTKTKYTIAAGAYPSWHPDGRHIVFSTNNINQYFCNGETRIEVADKHSDIVVYDTEENTITTSPKVSTMNRENLPIWSPDGKYLYYISAAPVTSLNDRIEAKYDLVKIPFDVNTNVWGEADTILSGQKLGESISFPKISPNGKYIMYCSSENGYFTIHHPMTDLNLLNLQTGEFQKMDINSDKTDSYHSFSSGGHWFVFTSKRIDGLFSRPFFSYLDENGKASKPFVLPQENPEFYSTFTRNYNIPQLITGEVLVSPLDLRDKILEEAIPAKIASGVDTVYLRKHLEESLKE